MKSKQQRFLAVHFVRGMHGTGRMSGAAKRGQEVLVNICDALANAVKDTLKEGGNRLLVKKEIRCKLLTSLLFQLMNPHE